MQLRVPLKTIITGEHAVLYGVEAVAAAVDLYVDFTFEKAKQDGVEVLAAGECLQKNSSEIVSLSEDIQGLDRLFVPIQLWMRFFNTQDISVKIEIKTPIEPGSGLGHSAALASGIIVGLSRFFEKDISDMDVGKLVSESEAFFHGNASGVDQRAVLLGGVFSFVKKDNDVDFQDVAVHEDFKDVFSIVFTGHAASSTAETVASVADFFNEHEKKKDEIIAHFSSVSNDISKALKNGDLAALQLSIAENQRLLSGVGVSSDVVDNLILELSEIGAFAKITGAGSAKGDVVGALLVCSENRKAVKDFAEKNNMLYFPVSVGVPGLLIKNNE